jgi:hypothetical protein
VVGQDTGNSLQLTSSSSHNSSMAASFLSQPIKGLMYNGFVVSQDNYSSQMSTARKPVQHKLTVSHTYAMWIRNVLRILFSL